MKTRLSGKIIMFLSFAALILISCSKKDDTIQPVTKPPVTNTPVPVIGSIVDSGAVNTGLRVMRMDLSTLPFTLYDANENVSYVSASTSAALYVNQDGLIPTGQYSFSDSDSKSPFTFSAGILKLAVGSDSYGTSSDKITDGMITITQDGNKYAVSLEINLASGRTTSQIFSGALGYEDSKK
jgi:hypothetical protein